MENFYTSSEFRTQQNELLKMNKETKDYQQQFGNPRVFDMSDFSTSYESQNPGFGYNPNYSNPLTAENPKQGMDYMNLSSDTDVDGSEATTTGSNTNWGGIAQSAVPAAMQAYQMASTTSNNNKESTGNALRMTAQGAQLGGSIGGPWGAAIGAIAGLAYGGIDGYFDARTRSKHRRENEIRHLADEHARLEQEQRMEESKAALDRLTKLRKAQLGYSV